MRIRAFHAWLILCLVAALALGSTAALAQAPPSQQPPPPPRAGTGAHEGFGIQLGGGPIYSNFTGAAELDVDAKAGWLVGLLMGGNRGGTVGVEADVLYGRTFISPLVGNEDFDQQVIHVPVMLKVNAGSGNVNGLSVFGVGGGFFDWQFDSKLGGKPSENTDGFEVGWVLGGGVEILRFSVQARLMRGVREISKTFDVANSQVSKSKGFVILFAFRLN